MDLLLFFSLAVFGLYIGYRASVRVFAKHVSNVPWYVGDPVHFAVGVFVTRVDFWWAALVTVLYLTYQVFDYVLNKSNVVKDIATYTAGVLAGLGFEAWFT